MTGYCWLQGRKAREERRGEGTAGLGPDRGGGGSLGGQARAQHTAGAIFMSFQWPNSWVTGAWMSTEGSIQNADSVPCPFPVRTLHRPELGAITVTQV